MSGNITLKDLRLSNFATFKQQVINFNDNFNAIVGETGSGKSLILDALNFIMGQRADKKFIRKSADFSIIEARYEVSGEAIKNYFIELGYPFEENEVHIKRVLYRNGTSKCFLNHQQCNLKTIIRVSKRFIDLVGQFENQKLLSPKYQLQLIDRYGNLETEKSQYRLCYNDLKSLQKEQDEKQTLYADLKEKKDFYEFQIKEIEQLDPSIEREKELISQKNFIQDHQSRMQAKFQLEDLIERSQAIFKEINVATQSKQFLTPEVQDIVNSITAQIDELSYEIARIDVSIDELEDLDDILEELSSYQKLKRKFGGSIESLTEYYENLKAKLDEINILKNDLEHIAGEIAHLKNQCLQKANELTKRRQVVAKDLSKSLTNSIQMLNMKNAKIKIEVIESDEINEDGNCRINFLAQMNKGEGFHSIQDTASGGELSRILLSMRHILSSTDSISIFLFDEIDTGIGGETAKAIGNVLSSISKSTQVVAITHLPQIAYRANQLILVNKATIQEDKQQRTTSVINHLQGKEIQKEVELMRSIS